MRSVLLLLLSFFTPVIWAQNVEQSKLWPDKQNANEAEIYIYHPKESDKVAPAVLICPGGGYSGLAMDREGHDMAKWYASNGFVAVDYIMKHFDLYENELMCDENFHLFV